MTDQDENVKVCGLKVGMLVRVSWGIPLVVWKTIEDWAWNSTSSSSPGNIHIPPGTKGVVVAEHLIPPSTPGAQGFPATIAYHPRTNIKLRYNVLYQILWEDEKLTWSWPQFVLPLENTPDCDPFFEKRDAVFDLK